MKCPLEDYPTQSCHHEELETTETTVMMSLRKMLHYSSQAQQMETVDFKEKRWPQPENSAGTWTPTWHSAAMKLWAKEHVAIRNYGQNVLVSLLPVERRNINTLAHIRRVVLMQAPKLFVSGLKWSFKSKAKTVPSNKVLFEGYT